MSRNTEYQFVSTNPALLEAELIAKFEDITGRSVHPADPEKVYIQWVKAVILHERVQTNYAGNQNLPSRADNENLDALGELFCEQTRPDAKAATCKMRFSISAPQDTAILVPSGTRVSDASNTLVWQTTADAYIPIGGLHVEVIAQCQTVGVTGNGYAAGQISKLIDIYDYYSECQNITVSDGGADRANDDEFFELMRASMDGFSCAGARGGYAYFAKRVSTEIADVVPNSPSPGVVKIYILMNDGTLAGEEIKNRVLAECSADERRPLTDHVLVEDAEIVRYDIKFTYYLQNGRSKSAAEIAAGVNEAVERYVAWQCAKLGRDINPDELREYLYHTGVKRIELTAPVFTALRDGRDKKAPQVASIGTITVTNGGYEDE